MCCPLIKIVNGYAILKPLCDDALKALCGVESRQGTACFAMGPMVSKYRRITSRKIITRTLSIRRLGTLGSPKQRLFEQLCRLKPGTLQNIWMERSTQMLLGTITNTFLMQINWIWCQGKLSRSVITMVLMISVRRLVVHTNLKMLHNCLFYGTLRNNYVCQFENITT